jgi:hypothetical protein
VSSIPSEELHVAVDCVSSYVKSNGAGIGDSGIMG